MFKKRTRPQTVVREKSIEVEGDKNAEEHQDQDEEGEPNLPIADLIEWRKLRRAREGIDAAKLNVGDAKKSRAARKRARDEENEKNKGGLTKGHVEDDDVNDEEAKEAKARRVVRANNFTQQTNTLDVDKHLMAYIEENLKVRSRPKDSGDNEEAEDDKPYDPQDELFKAASEKWRLKLLAGTKETKQQEEGSVTSSMGMLTAIPEVDLGMDTRLKNIEETEKAKRIVAEERNDRRNKVNNDEEHLVASRFYRPNLRAKSDADILRDAKLEAMGLNPQDHDHSPHYQNRSNHDRPQMATDEMVMERFKKRMRK